MKRETKTLLNSMTWANLMVFTISLTLQTFPTHAFADDPAPVTAPAPDTAAARATGRADSIPDGAREGHERGPVDGQRAGEPDGYRRGFANCEREARERAYDQGFQRGMGEGSIIGSLEGQRDGDREGAARGVREGEADGTRRADNDSNEVASPRGRAQGITEANNSDATDRGRRDGTIRGDADAAAEAKATDYPRGRKEYNDARYAETPQSHGEIMQKAAPAPARPRLALSKMDGLSTAAARDEMMAQVAALAPAPGANPDFRYMQFKKTYPTPQENQAYAEGARAGYGEGFRDGYSSSYDAAYRDFFGRGERRGCDDARRREYREDFDRGARDGRERGYREAYDRAFRNAAQFAYSREFAPASSRAYSANYDGFYSRHFESARAAAYAARVSDLYNSAFDSARSAKYAEMYPGYAKAQYKRGQEDEAQEFAQRPVRIMGVEATETILNNVFEPGEPLRVHLQVRNFADSELRAQDLSVQITAQNPDQSIVTIKQENVAQSLKAKSVTEIREALEFQATELAAGRVQRFNVKVTYQGKVIDSTVLEIRPRFMVQVELAETPSFKEGIAMPIRVKLTNAGNKTANGIVLNLKTRAEQLEVAQPTFNVGAIAAGETKVVEFSAIGRDLANSSIELGFVATEGGSLTGRRVGVLDLSSHFPVVNDYRIDLANNAVAALRTAGVIRLAYHIKNESRRIMFNSLQLKVRFINTEDASNFVVIGPNPQFLMPMDQGEVASFTVPVLVKSANRGGTIEVEVQEAGRTVVIHREDFSQGQPLN